MGWTTGLCDGQWHHVAVTFPAGGSLVRDVKIFVDGHEDTGFYSNGDTQTVNTGTDYACEIGAFTGGTPSVFNGQIDDVRVYDRALTDAEILAIASEAIPTYYEWTEPTLVAELNTFDPAMAPHLSDDGLTMYFTRANPNSLVEAYRDNPYGPFISERILTELGTAESAWVSSDQLRMYFNDGTYPGERVIWYAERSNIGEPWTKVRSLATGVTKKSGANIMGMV